MYIFKNQVTLENRDSLEKYLKGFRYKTSGLTFSSLYMWRDINLFSWEKLGKYVCICGTSHLELEEDIILPFMDAPLTDDGTYHADELKKTVLMAKERFEENGQPFSMRLVPKSVLTHLEDAFGDRLIVEDDRANYDYIYRKEDLINLRGRSLHSKKNHLNFFNNHYAYKYEKMTKDMADDAMVFIKEFNAKKDIPPHEMELLMMEERAMRNVFEHVDEGGYQGGVIYIDGKIEALSVGSVMNENMAVVHIEKGNTDYRGIYQAINAEYCKHLPEHITLVNREEDMGLPGLRKAKLSYKPVELLEKYIVTLKD